MIEGNGPFSELGKEVYDIYWKYYPRYRMKKEYNNLDTFFKWLPDNWDNIELFYPFDRKTIEERIKQYRLQRISKIMNGDTIVE